MLGTEFCVYREFNGDYIWISLHIMRKIVSINIRDEIVRIEQDSVS